MIEDRAIRACREQVLDAPADRWGCIRIRRSDVLAMLDLITAQDEALDRLKPAPAPPRFADRLQLRGPLAKPAKIRP